MEELKVFDERELFGKNFKIYGTVEEPLFLAKDVADWIDHSNITKMLNVIDDEEKVKIRPNQKLGLLTPNNEYNFLTEDGLYEVLMQSRKPIAKQFKKEVKKILKQLRQTGGVVVEGREEEFINNYFPSFSEEVKKAMTLDLYHRNQEYKKQLETQNKLIKSQQETIEVQVKEIEHKEDTIIDLTKGINITEKRQRITQIVRYRAKGNYQERYNLLYRELNAKYHIDVQRRMKNGKENGTIKKSVNLMEYICSEKYLNMTNELYDLCIKIFEADFIELLEEWKDTINK